MDIDNNLVGTLSETPPGDLDLHRDGQFDEYGHYHYCGDGGEELFLPDKLFLFCNRGGADRNCLTWLHSMQLLYDATPPADRAILSSVRAAEGGLLFDPNPDGVGGRDSQVEYQQRLAPSRIAGDNPPVIYGPPNAPRVSIQESREADSVRSDPAACAAYGRLWEHARATRTGVHLVAGDLCIVRNNRALHGRSPFMPRGDDTDRWLTRYSSFTHQQLRDAKQWTDALQQQRRRQERREIASKHCSKL